MAVHPAIDDILARSLNSTPTLFAEQLASQVTDDIAIGQCSNDLMRCACLRAEIQHIVFRHARHDPVIRTTREPVGEIRCIFSIFCNEGSRHSQDKRSEYYQPTKFTMGHRLQAGHHDGYQILTR